MDRILSAELAQQAAIEAMSAQVQSNGAKLDQILSILNEDPIAGANLTLSGGQMKTINKHFSGKAKLDFVLADNGTATGTISFTDSVGEPTVPVAGATVATNPVSSDPGVTVSVDATQLILTVTPTTPLPTPLPVGVTITATIVITNPDTTTITLTAVSDPLDVVAGGPAGASISLQ